jgi:hypothetical protein
MPFYHPVIEEALQAALYDLYAKVELRTHPKKRAPLMLPAD